MKKELLPFAIVVLLGYLGFSLPLPILPEMFLDPERSLLPVTFSMRQKTFLLGLFMTSYPLGQFCGGPLLGQLSDRFGRKKVILCSLTGAMIGYAITALSVDMKALSGIFFGLLVCGFSEGNVAIAQSVIADLTEHHERGAKAAHFGWINLFVTFGFIIGPLIGGNLADPKIFSWFTFATPFWGAACLTLLAIVVIWLWSKETKKRKSEIEEITFTFFKGIVSLFTHVRLRGLYLANFFLALGFFSFFRFFPVYLERRFDFTSSGLAYVISYDSVAFAVALIFLIKPLARALSPLLTTAIFALVMGAGFIFAVMPGNPYSVLYTVPPIGICLAIVITNGAVMISDAADQAHHGQAMGNLQSIQVLAEILTGIVGGMVAAVAPKLPLFLGAAMGFICALILFFLLRKKSAAG